MDRSNSSEDPHTEAMHYVQEQMEMAEKRTNYKKSKSKEHQIDPYSALMIKSVGIPANYELTKEHVISDFFSTRVPRDAGAGLSSGLKSVTKGVAFGMASLVVCPMVGVSEQGLKGFFKGVGAGVMAAIMLPLAGVGVAGYQISRGVINTPKAICKKAKGKVWSKQHREWRDNWYSLEEEAAEVLDENREVPQISVGAQHNTLDESGPVPLDVNRTVVDMEFYEILGVNTNATQEEIRRRYYKLAKKYHPDRNGPEASTEMFKRLGEAYQVLGDEERREKYDRMGKSATNDMPILDSSLFFMMLFGSEDFEPLIGKLRMALFVELELNSPDASPTNIDFEKSQTAREVKVALNLRDVVRPFVCGDVEHWRNEMHTRAKSLCKNYFSTSMVETIGWTYGNYAHQYLGKLDTFLGIGGRIAKIQEQSRSFGKGFKTLRSIVKTAVAERSLLKSRKNGEEQHLLHEDYVGDVCESTLPEILDVMLNICLMDIQGTVRTACKRVLKDMGVDIQWRRKRAQALVEMGKIFIQAAAEQRQRFEQEGTSDFFDAFVHTAKERHMHAQDNKWQE
ncbi:bifunctional DnaJ domain/DnaJ domain [Babesia duncani]|uniref:Bifunctional DnaJ domain/DnaJ domain n=1 Tax=Babesia duncani TaxID=323732 RepID=A0AAD9PM83_9APIC|nr:bifunctional DnaJ domain/DnaJ domain [Babesia duncani]